MSLTPSNVPWDSNRYKATEYVISYDSNGVPTLSKKEADYTGVNYNFASLPTGTSTATSGVTTGTTAQTTTQQQTSEAFGDVKPHYWENESTVSGIDVNRIKQPTGSPYPDITFDGPLTQEQLADYRYQQNRANAGAGYYGDPNYIGGFSGNITQKGPGRTWTDEEPALEKFLTKYGRQPNLIERGAKYLAKSPGFNAVKGILQDVLPLYNRRAIKEKEYGNQGIAIDSGTGKIVFQQQGWTTDAHGNRTWGAISHLDPRNIMAGYNVYHMNAETIDKRINKILNRKKPQTNSSRAKIVALRNFKKGIVEKAEKTTEAIIDRRIKKERMSDTKRMPPLKAEEYIDKKKVTHQSEEFDDSSQPPGGQQGHDEGMAESSPDPVSDAGGDAEWGDMKW